jgi:cell division protein FtsI/penicillin-binding protein 2
VESLRKTFVIAVLFALLLPMIATGRGADSQAQQSLFAQSSRALLQRDFSDPNISYLLVDAATGEQIAARWEDPDKPVPVGSLVKPFAALAYAQHHDSFPKFICHGTSDRCWLPRGHGELNLTSAIAQSCNAYFRKLSRQLPREDVDDTIRRYGAGELRTDAPLNSFYGIEDAWRMSAHQVVSAFRKLATSQDRGAAEVRRGMLLSAKEGTSRVLSHTIHGGALAKTGTAPCSHLVKAPGDGFVVVMFPADSPKNILVVRLHGSTGAKSAEVAAKMLTLIEDQYDAH